MSWFVFVLILSLRLCRLSEPGFNAHDGFVPGACHCDMSLGLDPWYVLISILKT